MSRMAAITEQHVALDLVSLDENEDRPDGKWQLFPPGRGIPLQPFRNTPSAQQDSHVCAHVRLCVSTLVSERSEDSGAGMCILTAGWLTGLDPPQQHLNVLV